VTELPQTVAFHVGVHKTATSHLQRCLRRSQDGLLAQGVRYVGPSDLRAAGQWLADRFGFGATGITQADHANALAGLAQGAARLILSEENYIGPLLHPGTDPVTNRYVRAGYRLSRLAEAMDRQIDVFIALRHPLDFLNAAYSQSLIAGHLMQAAAFQQQNPVSGVKWAGLLRRLRAAEGIGQITVWRYEDYRVLFPEITTALVGGDASEVVLQIDKRVNPSLSEEAVAAMTSGKMDAATARKALPSGPDHAPFDGYHADQRAMADAAYAAAWEEICAIPGVTPLTP